MAKKPLFRNHRAKEWCLGTLQPPQIRTRGRCGPRRCERRRQQQWKEHPDHRSVSAGGGKHLSTYMAGTIRRALFLAQGGGALNSPLACLQTPRNFREPAPATASGTGTESLLCFCRRCCYFSYYYHCYYWSRRDVAPGTATRENAMMVLWTTRAAHGTTESRSRRDLEGLLISSFAGCGGGEGVRPRRGSGAIAAWSTPRC